MNISFMIIAFVTIYTSSFGITAGVHRLWSHKAYKAKWPLRLLLVFLFTITGQVCKHLHNSNNLCTINSLLLSWSDCDCIIIMKKIICIKDYIYIYMSNVYLLDIYFKKQVNDFC